MALQRRSLLFTALMLVALPDFVRAAEPEMAPIQRVLPPVGIELSDSVRGPLEQDLSSLQQDLKRLEDHPHYADTAIYGKAVDYALRHREIYSEKEIGQVKSVLQEGRDRAKLLAQGKTPWTTSNGLVVRGYRSRIDGSVQPYGLVIPESVDLTASVSPRLPLYVWLHGRGDKQTDIHFIRERSTKPGQITPNDAIVVHPFGRHCLGFKSAGEIDVLEVVDEVCRQYPVDPNRIVLLGFSMGGAGAWHLGAHYTDRWRAVCPGAGFAETAQYQNLKPEKYPPSYEQTLWGVYDVPNYVRNLFNTRVVAYSGENDKQIQAARVMESAFTSEGRSLQHLIGPGMGHQYHPQSLAEILQIASESVQTPPSEPPARIALQTRTLRYSKMHWVQLLGLKTHWQDTRLDALIESDRRLKISTRNVTRLRLNPFPDLAGAEINIDGQSVKVPTGERVKEVELLRKGEGWTLASSGDAPQGLVKHPGLQGPIDDVFLEPFLVVLPSGKSAFPAVDRWVENEAAHFQERWRTVFRGELRIKRDTAVTEEDLQRFHVIAWGTPASNQLIRRASEKLPIHWDGDNLQTTTQKTYSASQHVPVLIYPNPLRPDKYLVLNSGPTFREAHDRTNSLQNPKLPDWAILDISTPPTAEAAGSVVAAGFFDEQWNLAPF